MDALTRQDASDAVTPHGWRYVLGVLRTSVAVGSLAEAAEAARVAVEAADAAGDSLRLDLRPDRVVLTAYAPGRTTVTVRETALALRTTAALRAAGFVPLPDGVQVLEIAIDALDIAAVRPFWKAVLDYVDETADDGPESPIVDPRGQAPAVWFQPMDAPRPQRNRIHLDVSVPHDEMHDRVATAIAAGGRITYDAEAPAFVVLADAEGNEACVTSWLGRD
jgi:4a-hydroxytetrahydrobiopterin dehydratase